MSKYAFSIAGTGVLLALAVAAAVPVEASTTVNASSRFLVTLTVNAACTITTPSTMTFPASGVITSALTASATFNVTCTNGTPYDIGMDAGQGSGATTGAGGRKMSGTTTPTNTVAYSLYQDSGHNTLWGNTVGTDTNHQTANGQAQSYTVYGVVPVPATQPAPDTYTDNVLASVTF
jgi:spore coat protein U-like protein